MKLTHAIILAAGRGSRLNELTRDTPKCMIEVAETPLLVRQTRVLRQAGITSIGVVRGYRAERVESSGLTTFDNHRWEDTNMVSSLLCARAWLQSFPCIVSYADIAYPASTAVALTDRAGDIVVPFNTEWRTLWEKRFADPLTDAETFRVNGDGTLADIGSRARSLDEIEGQYMGLLKFTPAGWRSVEAVLSSLSESIIAKLDMTSLLRMLCEKGLKIGTLPVAGKWLEVDSPKDLELYSGDSSVAGWLKE